MQKNEFLELCQKCSVLPERICGIKRNVPIELTVIHKGLRYYPVGCIISFDNEGKAKYMAILHDLNSNSTTHAELERVSKYEQG